MPANSFARMRMEESSESYRVYKKNWYASVKTHTSICCGAEIIRRRRQSSRGCVWVTS